MKFIISSAAKNLPPDASETMERPSLVPADPPDPPVNKLDNKIVPIFHIAFYAAGATYYVLAIISHFLHKGP